MRSLAVQICSNRGHSSSCIVWGSVPSPQFRSLLSSKYPHLWRNSLERPTPILSRLRHFHSVHLASAPVAYSSLGLSVIDVAGIRLEHLSSHIAILILLEENVVRGLMLFSKLSLDANRFAASTFLKRGRRISSTSLLRSFMLATRRLIIWWQCRPRYIANVCRCWS